MRVVVPVQAEANLETAEESKARILVAREKRELEMAKELIESCNHHRSKNDREIKMAKQTQCVRQHPPPHRRLTPATPIPYSIPYSNPIPYPYPTRQVGMAFLVKTF